MQTTLKVHCTVLKLKLCCIFNGSLHKIETIFTIPIEGLFIKSLVPNSSAHLAKQIRVHDLIVEVNGKNLETRRHADAVRTLIKSGSNVKLKMIRFHPESPQAICLKMLHEQVRSIRSKC